MSDQKKRFKFKPDLPEIEGTISKSEDAVQYRRPSNGSAPFWIPLDFLEEIPPPREEPKQNRAAELDVDGDVWQRYHGSWYCANTNAPQDVTWERLQRKFGPTKAIEL